MNDIVIPSQGAYNSKLTNKLFSKLTEKEQIGYNFEIKGQSFFSKLNIPFSGNPLNKFLWKRLKGKGTDIQTDTLDIECKFVRCKVYPAHLKRNVYPRFKNDNKRKIVLTNDKSLWTSKAIDRLNESRIFLWNEHDVKEYYSKPSFTSIYNFIRITIECISNLLKFTVSRVSSIFNKYETNRTEVLNGYFTDKSSNKTDKREGHSEPKLNCYNCIKRDSCSILSEIEHLKSIRPQISLKQLNITDKLESIAEIDKEQFRRRRREWYQEFSKLWIVQQKCLNKRLYLHLNMNYKLFNIEPSSTSHKV
jgi:hypothetical protein